MRVDRRCNERRGSTWPSQWGILRIGLEIVRYVLWVGTCVGAAGWALHMAMGLQISSGQYAMAQTWGNCLQLEVAIFTARAIRSEYRVFRLTRMRSEIYG